MVLHLSPLIMIIKAACFQHLVGMNQHVSMMDQNELIEFHKLISYSAPFSNKHIRFSNMDITCSCIGVSYQCPNSANTNCFMPQRRVIWTQKDDSPTSCFFRTNNNTGMLLNLNQESDHFCFFFPDFSRLLCTQDSGFLTIFSNG